jgi:hypothetical protein
MAEILVKRSPPNRGSDPACSPESAAPRARLPRAAAAHLGMDRFHDHHWQKIEENWKTSLELERLRQSRPVDQQQSDRSAFRESSFRPMRQPSISFTGDQRPPVRLMVKHSSSPSSSAAAASGNLCGGSRSRSLALAGDYLAEDPKCAYQPKATSQPKRRLMAGAVSGRVPVGTAPLVQVR